MNPKPRVRIHPKADLDLDEQADYLAQGSLTLARRFLTAADRTFAQLARMPGMGMHKQLRNARLAGIRQWRVRGFEQHLIFYREIAGGIEVVRVLHAARDIDSILERETGI